MPPMPPSKPNKAMIIAFLKAHGHRPADVDRLNLDTPAAVRQSLCELHGLTAEWYLATTGINR